MYSPFICTVIWVAVLTMIFAQFVFCLVDRHILFPGNPVSFFRERRFSRPRLQRKHITSNNVFWGRQTGVFGFYAKLVYIFFFRYSGSIAAVWSTFARLLCFKSTLIVRNASFSLLNRGFLKMLISTEFLTEMSRQTKSYALWC